MGGPVHAGSGFFYSALGWRKQALAELLTLWQKTPLAMESYSKDALLGVARVVDCWPIEELPEEHRSWWTRGPFCWLLDDVVPLEEPIKARGQQGLWPVNPKHVTRLRQAYRDARLLPQPPSSSSE